MVGFEAPIQDVLVCVTGYIEEPGVPLCDDLSSSKDKEDDEAGENAEVDYDVVVVDVCRL
jgi:hypothetical protein